MLTIFQVQGYSMDDTGRVSFGIDMLTCNFCEIVN